MKKRRASKKKATNRKAGRPSKFTPSVRAAILKAIEDNNTKETAAAIAGISVGTLHGWLAQGRKAEAGPFFQFSEAVKKAEAGAEAYAIKCVREAMVKNWTAAAWFLERRNPARYGRKVAINARVSEVEDSTLKRMDALLKDPKYADLAEALFDETEESDE